MDALTFPRPTVFKEIFSPLEAIIQERSRSFEAKKHPRLKLTLYFFVKDLVYYFLMRVGSLGLLVTELRTSENTEKLGLLPAGKSTFHEAFGRYSSEIFQQILSQLLLVLGVMAIPEIAALGTLLLVDSSLFPVISNVLWAEYKKNKNAIRLHLSFELNRMIPLEFWVAKGISNEKAYLRKILQEGVTYIADRNYVAFKLFASIAAKGAFFIIRAKENMLFSIKETLALDIPDSCKFLFGQITDQIIRYTNDESGNLYRLVTFYVGSIKFYIVTNRRDLTTFQIILLYAYRWQIELIFRFLKRTMTGIHLINYSEDGIKVNFYLLIITAILQLHFKQRCEMIVEGKAQKQDHNLETTTSNESDFQTVDVSSQFIALIGEKLNRYWKISIHWLQTLRNLIAQPFGWRQISLLTLPP